MNNTDTKDRICAILRATGRPGIEAVIGYLENSSYFKRGCYGHHKEYGGLARHSLEVYGHMMEHTDRFPSDTIAVAGLLHDLGKTAKRDGRGHWQRSIDILDRLAFELTPDERTAILRHHDKSLSFLTCPLRRALTLGDMASTGAWKRAHPELCRHHRHHRKPSKHHESK